MSTGWKALIVIMAIAMLVGGYMVFGRLGDADARADAAEARLATAEAELVRRRDLHVWVNQQLWPAYERTHVKVWSSTGDPDPPALPPPPPSYD